LPDPAVDPASDLAPLLAELDSLAEQATALRVRIARLSAASSGARPGWPIRRLGDETQSAATRPGSGALRLVAGQAC